MAHSVDALSSEKQGKKYVGTRHIAVASGGRTDESEMHYAEGKLDLAISALSSAIFLKVRHLTDRRQRRSVDSKFLDECVCYQPMNAELYRRRAEIYIKLCDLQSAVINYRRAVSLDPQHMQSKRRLAGLYYARGNACLEEGNWEKAGTAYKEAIKNDPKSHDYRMGRIRVWFHQHMYQSALTEVEHILKKNPSHIPGRLMRAKIFLSTRKFMLALSDIETSLKAEPDNIQAKRLENSLRDMSRVLYNEAAAFFLSKESHKAITRLNMSIELEPTIKAYRLRATVHRHLNKFTDAISDLKVAVNLFEEREDEPMPEELKEIERQLAVTLNDVGVNLLVARKYGDAILCFEKAVARDSQCTEYWVNLSRALLESGDNAKALATFELTLKVFCSANEKGSASYKYTKSQIAVLRNERGLALANYMDYKNAEIEHTIAINMCDAAIYRYNRAESRLKLLNMTGAFTDISRALELDPSFKPANERYHWLKGKINPR
ncbi:hypothetical protein AAMO2058_000055500 [Amorphochlora amoebiformis]